MNGYSGIVIYLFEIRVCLNDRIAVIIIKFPVLKDCYLKWNLLYFFYSEMNFPVSYLYSLDESVKLINRHTYQEVVGREQEVKGKFFLVNLRITAVRRKYIQYMERR